MPDVIVVGAGPGGCAAAKRCAEQGLKTVLLEKEKLPREKLCTGMVMSSAQPLVEREFGGFPPEAVAPFKMVGYMLHVAGTAPRRIESRTLLAWRKDLDYWMVQKAEEKGAQIRDEAAVTQIREEEGGYVVGVGDKGEELRSRALIGADGTASTVRKGLFAQLMVPYSPVYRECYQGRLDIEREYNHAFILAAQQDTRLVRRFSLVHKGNSFVIHMAPGKGELAAVREHARQLLAGEYGFDLREPVWKDSCPEPVYYDDLASSGRFSVGKGNALLVGDAAGLLIPVTAEGIGTAIQSGAMAAACIARALESGGKADSSYQAALEPMLVTLRQVYPLRERLVKSISEGPDRLADAFKEAWETSLRLSL